MCCIFIIFATLRTGHCVLKHRATACCRSSDCASRICTRFRMPFACRVRPFILSKIFPRGLQMWRVTVHAGLQPGTADSGWSPASGLGFWPIMLHRERRQRVMTCYAGPTALIWPLEWTGNRKMDMRSGPWKFKTLCRAGALGADGGVTSKGIPERDNSSGLG